MEKLLPDIAANSMGFAVAAERYRPYPAYRDSGVEWLGEVPAHWVVARMWQVSEAISGGTPERDEPRYWDGTIPWVSPKDMKRRLLGYTEERITERGRRDAGLKLINPPAVLVVVRGMILAHSFPVAVSTVPLTINQDMKALKLRADIEPRYFGWLLDGISRRILSTVVEKAAHGTRAIRMDHWRTVDFPLPPVCEQRAVADFLDCETGNIDTLVAKKERLIELLKEKRVALITRAVTKGIDPDAAMKDSGVEWLADIPERWNTARMWQLSEAISGGTPSRDESRYWGGSIPWVSPKDMKRRLLDDTEENITERGRIEGGLRLVRPPAVLIVVRGMILAHSFPVALASVPLTINQDMKALKLDEGVDARYFGWLLDGVSHQILATAIEKSGHGTRAVRMDEWRSVELPLPPILEQRSIVEFLDCETTKIDALVAKVHEAIDHLKELRTALISAAVTGKIDVRDAVP